MSSSLIPSSSSPCDSERDTLILPPSSRTPSYIQDGDCHSDIHDSDDDLPNCNIHFEASLESGKIIIVDVPVGKDVVLCLSHFCSRYRVSLIVLSGSGWLSDVILLGNLNPIPIPLLIDSLSGNLNFPADISFPPQVMLSAGLVCEYRGEMVGGKAAAATVKVEVMVRESHSFMQGMDELMPVVTGRGRMMTAGSFSGMMMRNAPSLGIASPSNSPWFYEQSEKAADDLMQDDLMAVVTSARGITAGMNQRPDRMRERKQVTTAETAAIDNNFWDSLTPIVDLSLFGGFESTV